MAADVVDRAARRLGGLRRDGGQVSTSRTADLPLLGADGYHALWTNRADLARRHGISVGVLEHLLERYGSLAFDVPHEESSGVRKHDESTRIPADLRRGSACGHTRATGAVAQDRHQSNWSMDQCAIHMGEPRTMPSGPSRHLPHFAARRT